MLALLAAYAVSVLFFWTPETKDYLRRFTIPFWILVAASLSGLWPTASVLIFIVLCFLLIAGLATEVLDVHDRRKSKGKLFISKHFYYDFIFILCN